MKWLERRREKKRLERLSSDWVMVAVKEASFIWNDLNNKEEKFNFFLYENPLGQRRYEVKSTGQYAESSYKRHSIFLNKIYPWFKGENFSDIPSYHDKRFQNNEIYVDLIYRKMLRK